MSVCTGAFQLGKAGLLEGLKATTHHEFWDDFTKTYPQVNLERGVRFVDNGHIATAKYMEYSSERWKGNGA